MSYIGYDLMNTKIFVGSEARKEIAGSLKQLGVKKPLIVTDENIFANYYDQIVGKVVYELESNGLEYAIYHGVMPDPKDFMVEDGLKALKENNCDGVIGLGGGSSMDTGKCVAIMAKHEGKILDYSGFAKRSGDPEAKDFHGRGVPYVSVCTTSGTGSEVSKAAVVTRLRDHRKTSIASPLIMSRYAFLDTDFLVSLPKFETAYTGMDALCHAVESYTFFTTVAEPCKLCDAMTLKAIELIGQNLVKAYNNPNDLEARKNMQWGALMAGVGLNLGAGESHAIGSMLSKYYEGVFHGVSVGLTLPYCIKYSIKYCPDRYADIARALGKDTTGLSDEEAGKLAAVAVKELLEQLNFPKMKDYVKSKDDIEKWAEECAGNSCCIYNKRMNTKETIIKVCNDIYDERL